MQGSKRMNEFPNQEVRERRFREAEEDLKRRGFFHTFISNYEPKWLRKHIIELYKTGRYPDFAE